MRERPQQRIMLLCSRIRWMATVLVVFRSFATTTTSLLIPRATLQRIGPTIPSLFRTQHAPTTQIQLFTNSPPRRIVDNKLYLRTVSDDNDDIPLPEGSTTIWNTSFRNVMGGLAALGTVETLYLTYSDLHDRGGELIFCSSTSEDSIGGSLCSSVLSSPYAHIPGTDVPIALVGSMAYMTVFGLAIYPLLQTSPNPQRSVERINNNNDDDDSMNRVLLLAITTTMGVFSVFLMSILFNVLHQTCLYCIMSAVLSIGLMSLAWFGNLLPAKLKKEGLSLSLSGGILSMLAALVLVVTNESSTAGANNINTATNTGPTTSTLLATTGALKNNLPPSTLTAQEPPLLVDQVPPAITTESSSIALDLAVDLQKLDARFYGAYWCSHCYDQKQAFGKQAMQRIPYVECSREGKNEQAGLCKEKKIPGYPTWEISGKLYPGEKDLDEIREIVVRSMAKAAN